MSDLAIHGGDREVRGSLKRFSTIGLREEGAAIMAMRRGPLSGYLAGRPRGGYYVQALEERWAETFGVKHAVACNSATSGLLAAAFAVGLRDGDTFACSPYTMSATAAAPMFTGAKPRFVDVEDETFSLDEFPIFNKAIFVTNLFGHPARLANMRWMCDEVQGIYLIEDNAQSPFAMEHGKYAGTIGHIGVWSMNVHKHVHCGEGGMCVTDDAGLAHRIRGFINHGECSGLFQVGLNLRMTEVTAAIALVQLQRARDIIAGRVSIAEALIEATKGIPGLRPPVVRDGCTHVYYTVPFLVEKNRSEIVRALNMEGVPIVEGYQKPLYHLPAFSSFKRECPVAEDLENRRLFYWENCAWDPTPEQVKQIGNAFCKVMEKLG